jgi:hypothetical protein
MFNPSAIHNDPIEAAVKALLSRVSMNAFKFWLKDQSLTYSSSTKNEFEEAVLSLVRNKELTLTSVEEAIIGFEESGAKNIHLYNSDTTIKTKESLLKVLQGANIELKESPLLATFNSLTPALIYVTWVETIDGPQIRIKFTETHYHISVDKETLEVKEEARGKVIMIIQDVQDGVVQIRYDSLGDKFSHKDTQGRSSSKVFLDYYIQRAKEMLRVDVLDEYDLGKPMEWLSNTEDPRIFRLPHQDVRTGYNTRQSYRSLTPQADIRDDPAYDAAADADKENWLQEKIQGYWLQGLPETSLRQELFMGMNRVESRIWFARDCMPEELNYAISRIKSIEK